MMWGQQIDHSSRLGAPRCISLGRCQLKKIQEGVSGIGLFQFRLFTPGRNDEGALRYNSMLCDMRKYCGLVILSN
jgi:hypothetical protein